MFRQLGERERVGMVAVGAVFLLGISFIGTARLRQPSPLVIQSEPTRSKALTGTKVMGSKGSEGESSASELGDSSDAAEIVVDVKGAVKKPGPVHLPTGSRVSQALATAGGPSADADLDEVNLAAKLVDGQMVRIPRRGEIPTVDKSALAALDPSGGGVRSPTGAEGSSTGKAKHGRKKDGPPQPISINAATSDQLQTLPGIGAATAERIIDYRRAHGPFRSLDELAAVPGIGATRVAKIARWLRL